MKKFSVFILSFIAILAMSVFAACDASSCNNSVTYNVYFITYGGTDVETQSVAEGATVTEPEDPEKDFFTFAGWYTDETLATAYNFSTAMPAEDVYLYAKWTPEVSVKITYDSQGGTDVTASIGVVGEEFTAPESPTYEGWEFGGWYTEAECVNAYSFTVYPSESFTLYAKWNQSSSYAYVSYYGNGSYLQIVPVSKSQVFTEPDLFESGIITTGWYTDEARTQAYTFGTTLSANLSLYTTYYTEGLEFSGDTVTAYYGDSSTVVIPDIYNGTTITTIGEYAFIDTTHAESVVEKVVLPETVTTLLKGAFKDCIYLTEINITSNVTSIGEYVFSGDIRLTSLGDLSGITSIPQSAFLGCDSIYSITLSENLTAIGAYAFADCSELKSIAIPSKVTSIGEYAFSGCTSLRTVTIGGSSAYGALKTIGEYAFNGCSSLQTVTIYTASVTTLNGGSYSPFYGCSEITVYVPSGLVNGYTASYGYQWIVYGGTISFSDVLKAL